MSLFQDNVVCQEKNQRSKEKESVFSSLAVGLVEKMRVGNAHSIRIFSQKSLFCSVTIEVAKKVVVFWYQKRIGLIGIQLH